VAAVSSDRRSWLSITPEPERVLPAAIATLRARGVPSREAVSSERRRVERLVLRGSRRDWLLWLGEARRIAERAADDDALAATARDALDVIDNHDALQLGLPGRAPRESERSP
jgi:hypothetical protein